MLKKKVTKNGWLVGVTLFLVSTLAFVQAQKGLEEQLAGVRLEAQFIDYDEQGRLKPDCLLAIYGMPDYIVGGGGTPAQPGLMPSAPAQPETMPAQRSGSFYEALINTMRLQLGDTATKSIVESVEREIHLIRKSIIADLQKAKTMTAQETAEKIEQHIERIKEHIKSAEEAEKVSARFGAAAEVNYFGLLKLRLHDLQLELLAERAALTLFDPTAPISSEDIARHMREMGPLNLLTFLPSIGGAAGAIGIAPSFPHPEDLSWVIPPFVQLDTNEFYFVYRRQGAHLSFLMELRRVGDRNELRVVAITVAGRRYDGARTAKGDPFKSIKLGDDLQRVLLRYGQPDEIVYYNPLTLQVVNTPTRNLILRYHRSSNIEFTTLENKVVRIFIFLPRQVNFIR